MSYLSSYRNKPLQFPKDEIDPKKKNKKWAKEFGDVMLSMYCQDMLGFAFSKRENYSELRRYGRGKQDISQFQDQFLGKSENPRDIANNGASSDFQRKGFMNVDWRVFSPATKFRRVMVGKFLGIDHKISCQSLDPISGVEREDAKYRMWVESDAGFGKDIRELRQAMGAQDAPKTNFNPQSLSEFELYGNINGFKVGAEDFMQKLLTFSYYISNWDEIREKVFEDLFDLNAFCVKDYITGDSKIKAKYLDIRDVLIHKTKGTDFSQSTFAGHIEHITVYELRKILYAEGEPVDEDILRGLATKYQGYHTNTSYGQDYLRDDNDIEGNYKYDDFILPVLKYEWKSCNTNYKATRTTKYGNEISEDVEYGTKKLKKKKISKKSVSVLYEASYIINSEIVYGFGLSKNTPRDGDTKDVRLSYHVHAGADASLMETIRPNIDSIYRTFIKLQNAIAQSSNAGLAVEFGVLQNMKINGREQQPLDILTIRRQEGTLLYKATTHRGHVNGPGSYKPIQELKGGIGPFLDECVKIFELELNFIREHTGINQIVAGGDPNPEQSVGGSQLAVNATDNVLKPLYNSYLKTKRSVGMNFIDRGSLLIRHSKEAYEGYYPVIGKTSLEFMRIGKENISRSYGIIMRPELAAVDKMRVLDAAKLSLQAKTQGQPGIDIADYMLIERVLNSGNDRYAELYLQAKIEKSKARAMKETQDNIQLQAKEERAKADQAFKIGSEVKKEDYGYAKDLEKNKADQEIRVLKAQGEEDRKLETEKRITEKAKVDEKDASFVE